MSVTLHTNLGDIKLELFCESAPRACRNFLGLAAAGKYDGTRFHRVIRGFVAQGGDTTGTGKGGSSIYNNQPFADEFSEGLTHSKRGIVSMASKGPHTNLSQFFITFEPQPHLDNINTIFAKVIDGLSVLDKMEAADVDAKNRPVEPIVVERVHIHANPFAEVE